MIDFDVSIIVCTRNRHHDLDRCLDSLRALYYRHFDILVVDNSSNSDVLALNIDSCTKANARHIHEQRRGLSVARNRGIAETTGQIVAFTDDDCVPDIHWLESAVSKFQDESVACCTGRTVSLLADPLSAIFEQNYGFDRGKAHREFNHDDIRLDLGALVRALPYANRRRITPVAPAPFSVGLGNNMFFRRNVFGEIGYFDERLGAGTASEAGEEIDLFYRLLRARKKIVYAPDALVLHKHRRNNKDLHRAVYVCGLGVAAFLKKYIELGDFRAAAFYGGRLLNLLYAANSYKSRNDKQMTYLTSLELRGWINGLFKY